MKKLPRTIKGLHNPELLSGAVYPDVAVTSEEHGTYFLEGRIAGSTNLTNPNIMMIHGARADYTKADRIIVPLIENGAVVLNITVSGHGVTGHDSSKGFSLDDNLLEAQAFLDLMPPTGSTLIGQSMGGTTAVRLIQSLHENRFDKLILFYPAVFPDEVYPIPFGTDRFREVASSYHAFLESTFFDVIKKFRGKIMLFRGEYDGLDPKNFGLHRQNSVFTTTIKNREVYSPIPPEVFEEIMRVRPDTVYHVIPGADHQLAKWTAEHPESAINVAKKILDFINT